MRFCGGGVGIESTGIQCGDVNVHAGAGFNNMHNSQSEYQCQCTDNFKIKQGFYADAADFVQIPHSGNAGYNRTEDDRRNDHFNKLDKSVTKRLHYNGRFGI